MCHQELTIYCLFPNNKIELANTIKIFRFSELNAFNYLIFLQFLFWFLKLNLGFLTKYKTPFLNCWAFKDLSSKTKRSFQKVSVLFKDFRKFFFLRLGRGRLLQLEHRRLRGWRRLLRLLGRLEGQCFSPGHFKTLTLKNLYHLICLMIQAYEY